MCTHTLYCWPQGTVAALMLAAAAGAGQAAYRPPAPSASPHHVGAGAFRAGAGLSLLCPDPCFSSQDRDPFLECTRPSWLAVSVGQPRMMPGLIGVRAPVPRCQVKRFLLRSH
eukprot:scaffold57485_cov20-Tisochrysis_lutea.AAC.1